MKTAGRIAVALACAAAAIAALQAIVATRDAQASRSEPPGSPPGAGRIPVMAPVPRLAPIAGTIAVAGCCDAVPPDIAPVVEVLPDGAAVLRRPAPLARGPVAESSVGHSGDGAALVLPAPLAELSPISRAAVLAVIGQWFVERPVAPSRLRAADATLDAQAVAVLLRWLP